MGFIVPIPKGIKDRAVYQALIKLARGLSRATSLVIENEGTVAATDQPAIGGGANFTLVESIEVDTGILWTDYNRSENVYLFNAGFLTGNVVENGGGASGDPSIYVDVVVKPFSYNLVRQTVRVTLEIYCRRIDSYTDLTLEWKAKYLY